MDSKKTLSFYMRSLHRDIGFLVIGLTIIYCISGILLVYRDTGLFKNESHIERQLQPGIDAQRLGMILHLKDFKVLKTEGDIIYFKNGTFNMETGKAEYTAETLPYLLERFNALHKSSSRSPAHMLSVAYGVLLIFLAISSFWMYRPGSRPFRRGLIIALTGCGTAAILILV